MIDLKNAIFKGVEFLFRDATTSGGNRLITHRYPGSDIQSMENQGSIPDQFNLTIIIPHDDYFNQRNSVLRVLTSKTKGTLIHPTFGVVSDIIAGEYKLIERITELGRAEITAEFYRDEATGLPIVVSDLPAQVAAGRDSLITQIKADIASLYGVTASFAGNFSDALDTVDYVATQFRLLQSLPGAIEASVAALQSAISNFATNAGLAVSDSQTMADQIETLFAAADDLYDDDFASATAANELLFSYGDDDPVIDPTTASRIERKANREIIRGAIKAVSLAYAYTNASQVSYNTTTDLDAQQQRLEDQYLDIDTLSNEAQELLDQVRVSAQAALDVARVNSRSIITINTVRRPLSVLLYAYYGNTDLFDTITDLNNIKRNAFVEGELKILTA